MTTMQTEFAHQAVKPSSNRAFGSDICDGVHLWWREKISLKSLTPEMGKRKQKFAVRVTVAI